MEQNRLRSVLDKLLAIFVYVGSLDLGAQEESIHIIEVDVSFHRSLGSL